MQENGTLEESTQINTQPEFPKYSSEPIKIGTYLYIHMKILHMAGMTQEDLIETFSKISKASHKFVK